MERWPTFNSGIAFTQELSLDTRVPLWRSTVPPQQRPNLRDAVYTSRYACSVSDAREYLALYGVAVVKALSAHEVLHARGLMHALLTSLTTCTDDAAQREKPFAIDDPETWAVLKQLGAFRGTVCNSYGVGQSEACWYVRTREGVVDAFARVHGTEPDMLTGSMDGFSAMFEHARPVYEGRSYKQNLWFHTDERPGAQHHTVQGTLLCC